MPTSEPPPLGSGDESARRLSRSDIRLLRRAVRGRWNVPEDERNESLYLIWKALENGPDERNLIGLTRCLIEMDKADLASDKHDYDRLRHEQAGTSTDDHDSAAKETLTRKLASLAPRSAASDVPERSDGG